MKHYISRKMFLHTLRPCLIAAVMLSVSDIADALVIGNNMGRNGLAVIGIITPLYLFMNFGGYTFSTGGCVTHSRMTAEGRDTDALSHFKTIVLVLAVISAMLAVAANLFLGSVLNVLGADDGGPELYRLCEEYARPLVTAIPLFVFNYLLYDFVRCDNDASLATFGFSAGCILDLALNIWFVIGLGWGMRGLIHATIIAQGVSVVILTTHLFNKRGILNLKQLIPAKLCPVKTVRRSLRIGLSSSVRFIFQLLLLLLGNRLLLRAGRMGLVDGELYVAVFDLVMNVSYVLYGVYQAFSDTMQPLASTYSAEHDRGNIRYLILIAVGSGLALGILCAAAASVFAKPISAFVGLRDADELAVSVRAIRLFCLSTPVAGMLIILTGFFQSTGHARLSGLVTILRTAVYLLPVTLIAGLLFPERFWALFLISESSTLVTMLIMSRFPAFRKNDAHIPVYSASMDNNNHELQRVLDGATDFCLKQQVPEKETALARLAIEELCMITIEKAFTGKQDEYIQLTLVKETSGDLVLHIRNSAPLFNPLDLRMEKICREAEDELMESIGVMMVRQKVRSLRFRHFQGFNMMTAVI